MLEVHPPYTQFTHTHTHTHTHAHIHTPTHTHTHTQNDIWQAQSWASLEWSGQWKLLHYYMSDVYRQLSASSLAEDNGIGIYIINDAGIQIIEYNLVIDVFTWKVGCMPLGP